MTYRELYEYGRLRLVENEIAEAALDAESGKILKEATGGMKLPFNLGF